MRSLLRHAPRTATVIATEELYGYAGYERALGCLLEFPYIAEKLVRTAHLSRSAFATARAAPGVARRQ